MGTSIVQRLGRLERAVAAVTRCPACAGGSRLVVLEHHERPRSGACEACGRELMMVGVVNPYSEEAPT